MEYGNIFEISASGMDFQRLRLEVIASNIANANTTRSNVNGLYRPLEAVASSDFISNLELNADNLEQLTGVKDMQVLAKDVAPRRVYDPAHPDADADGYVYFPNVNLLDAMTSLMTASRAYEANVSALNAAKAMSLKALEIGR